MEREGKGRGREGKRKKEGWDGKGEWKKGKDGKEKEDLHPTQFFGPDYSVYPAMAAPV